MKIYILKANEDWICDRLADEWYENNVEISTTNIHEADIVWLLPNWIWNRVPANVLSSKTVVTTIHHIDWQKFNTSNIEEFKQRDFFTNFYHVPCKKTKKELRKLTDKPILVQPFWVNQKLWYKIENKKDLKLKLDLPIGKKLIGSFQRDTEGHDLISPKLSKGPDIFCNLIEEISEKEDVHIVLAGWRRQYVIKRLEDKNIPYSYYKLCNFPTLNKLYNALDLYIVSSRVEGGPQAIAECALTETPIVSTDVGLASKILAPESIYDFDGPIGMPNIEAANQNIQQYTVPGGFSQFIKYFNMIRGKK